MENYEDKVHIEGTLEKALKIHELMSNLPPATFPVIEVTTGEKRMLDAEIIKESGGQMKELELKYHKESEERRRINIPEKSVYVETNEYTEITFSHGENNYKIHLKK